MQRDAQLRERRFCARSLFVHEEREKFVCVCVCVDITVPPCVCVRVFVFLFLLPARSGSNVFVPQIRLIISSEFMAKLSECLNDLVADKCARVLVRFQTATFGQLKYRPTNIT